MQDELVTFETAKLTKEKGFSLLNDPYPKVKFLYDYQGKIIENKYDSISYTLIPLPTQSLLQRWLREKHGYYILVLFHDSVTSFIFQIHEMNKMIFAEDAFVYNTYEEALEKGLQEGLKLIKS